MDRLISGAAAHLEMLLNSNERYILKGCESPIEEILAYGLNAHHLVESHGYIPRLKQDFSPFTLNKQVSIGRYRCDFLLEDHVLQVKCVIEADGHDFHERTKDQAIRDRSRDREMQSAGYLVMRFTGAEIYRDPWKCADEVFGAVAEFAECRDLASEKANKEPD